jgi:methylmalonyl-CoA/ethylmalonyl-CoA epimerase
MALATVFVDWQHQNRAAGTTGREFAVAFLKKNTNGGMHNVCYEVEDIYAARDRMKAEGATITGTGEPRIGAHGKPVIFLHPKDFVGTLVELEQA